MASVISTSNLGLYGNSLDLSAGTTTGRLGQSNTFYINATTGNLVVQAQDEYLASIGTDLSLVRTYNSQGTVDGDNDDGWRLGLYRRLHSLTGTINSAGSTITKTYGDGAEVVFTYDTGRALYVSAAGVGAHDTLSFNSGNNEWTFSDGNSTSKEMYNVSGQLVRLLDADSNQTTFTYTGALLTEVTTVADQTAFPGSPNQSTFLDYSGNNLSQIRVVISGVTETLTRYVYDDSNRLTQVTVDLSPEDNVIADGNTYTTLYTYDGTSKRIASITHGDTSTVAFTYEEIGTSWKVKTLTDGEGKVTSFTYTETTGTETYNLNNTPLSPWGAASTLESASGAAANAQVRFDQNGDGFALWTQSNNVLVSRYVKNTNTWAPAQTIDTRTNAITTPHLYVDASGNAIASWIQSNGTANSVHVSCYSVATNTWLSAVTVESIDSIAVNPIGTINAAGEAAVVFRQPAAGTTTPNNLYVARFAAGAWVAPELVEDPSNNITTVPSIAMDAQGNVQVLFLQSDGTANSIYTNRYTAATNTWSAAALLETSNTAASNPQVGFDQNGDGFAMWTTSADVIVRRYTQSTNTWATASTRDTRTNGVSVPQLYVHTSGNAIVTWIQSDGTANSVWASRYSVATDTWSTAFAVDNVTTIAANPAASINANGDAIVAWRQPALGTTTPYNLYASLYTEATNTWSTPESIESRTNDITTAPSVALDSQGNAQVVFIQSDGTANSVYTNRYSAGQKVSYLIPTGATWASIATALYGNANVADELQAALGNPPLTAGNRLTNLPASLINTTSTRVDVTDPLGHVTTYENNAQGRLIKVASPAIGGVRLETLYSYDNQGNLTQVIDAKNNATVMQYDTKGNLTLTRDALGNTVTRTYSASNQLLTETVYRTADPDGAGSSQPASPVYARFAYDSENHLRFVISPDGRVIEHRYAANGTRTASIVYASGTYTIGSTAPTEAQLNTWVGTQDRTKTERTDYVYDFRGNLSTATTYTATNSSGVGTGTASLTRYVYDQRGRLLQTIDPRGEATAGDPNDYVTSYTYDGLGRRLTTTQWVSASENRTTTTAYDDANNRTVTSLQNGLATTSVFDRRGLLVSVVQAAGAQALGTTSYQYDAAGKLRLTTDPIGNKTHVLYDEAGRVIATMDQTGALTETVYDNVGNAVKTIRYANRPTNLQLASLSDGSGNPANVTLVSLRPITDANNDRITRTVYDSANRAVMQLTSHDTDSTQAYVVQRIYDGASRLTDVIAYTNAISVTGLSDTAVPADVTARITTATTDRRTRYFYDNAGNTIATLDAEGYLTESIYSPAGHLTQTVAYATVTQASLRASGTLAQLRTSVGTNSNDQRTYRFVNAKGEVIATLDQEGYFSEYQYDLSGNQTQSIRYHNKGTTYTGTQTITQLRPTAHANDQVIVTTYNGANQITSVTSNPQGTVTVFAYDNVGNLIETERAWNTSDVRTTRARYDAKGQVLQELTGEGSLALDNLLATSPAATEAEIDALWDNYSLTHGYDLAGRRISTIDQNGHKTLFYYDEASRLSYSVNALGEVVAMLYNSVGQLTDRTRYTNRISTTGLTGGVITTDLLTRITAIGQATGDNADDHTRYNYTLRGVVKQAIESPNSTASATTTHTYNAFGELETKTTQLTDTATRLDRFTYDKRGLHTQTTEDEGTGKLNRLTTRQVDAFGRVTQTTDANGIVTTRTYDRLGRELTVTEDPSGLNRTTQTTYDAISRVLTTRDARGNTTTFTYNDATRRFTVESSQGITTTTETNHHGDVVVVTDGRGVQSTYSYDQNGNLKTAVEDDSVGGLRLSNARNYDRANRLIETTDANGTITTFQYDAANRVLTKTLDPAGLNLQTTTLYDGQGRTVTVTDGAGTPEASVTRTTYDAAGNVTSIQRDPDGLNLTTRYAVDKAGRTLTVTEGAGTPEASTTEYRYDNLHRRIESIKDPGGLNIRCLYTYDLNDNLTKKIEAAGTTDEQTTRFVYDSRNRLTYTVDVLGGVTRSEYDNNGNIIATTRYANAIGLAGLSDTSSEGDIASRLTPDSINDQVTRYAYDRDNRLAFTVDALRGLTQQEYNATGDVIRTVRYANPLPTNVAITVTNIASALTEFASPPTDRVIRTIYDAAGRAAYTLDAEGFVTESRYDGNGNIIEAVVYTNPVTLSQTAPSITQVQAALTVAVATDRRTRYFFDRGGRLVRTTDAEGYTEHYAYDAVGNKTSFTNKKGAYPNDPTYTWHYAYDRAGRLVEERTPEVGVTSVDPATLVSTNTCESIVTKMTYDALGNVKTRTEAFGAPEARTTVYVYDQLGRQIQTIFPPVGVYNAITDQAANYIGRNETLTTPTSTTYYDALGRAVASKDVNGNFSYKVYDITGRVQYELDAERYVTRYSYDIFDNQLTLTRHATALGEAYFTAREAAATDTTLQAITAMDVQSWISISSDDRTITNTYDRLNRIIETKQPAVYNFDSTTNQYFTASPTTRSTYNAFGQVIKQSTLRNLGTDNTANTADDQWIDVFFYFNRRGESEAQISALGYLTEHQYDAAGNLIETVEYAKALSSGSWSLSGYGSPTVTAPVNADSVSDIGFDRTIRHRYDRLNRKVEEIKVGVQYASATYGGVATITSALGDIVESYAYDALGNVVSTTDATGATMRVYYDALGRKTAIVEPTRVSEALTTGSAAAPHVSSISIDSPALGEAQILHIDDGDGHNWWELNGVTGYFLDEARTQFSVGGQTFNVRSESYWVEWYEGTG